MLYSNEIGVIIQQKARKKTCFKAHFQHSQSKISGLKEHIQLILFLYLVLDTLLLCSVGQQAWLCF